MNGYWIIRTYLSGCVGEKIKFWQPGERPTRSERRLRALARKQEQNGRAAARALARLINANFAAGDLLLGLDYSDEGMRKLEAYADMIPACRFADPEEDRQDRIFRAAERELKNCLRRVRRELGADILRYVAVTSDMNGDTGEIVRVHHHLVVSAGCQAAFLKKWAEAGLGGVSWETLREQDDYTPVAEYLLRQVRKRPDRDQYVSSRNLDRPAPRDRIVFSAAEVRVPKGGTLLYRSAYSPGQPQYVRYVVSESRPSEKGRRQPPEGG